MVNFIYPTAAELTQVSQDKLPRLVTARRIFDILPTRDVNAATIRWEQKDNYTGMQQARGMNGDPPRVKRIGGKVWQVDPGVYGEFTRVDEQELLLRRNWGTWNTPVSIDDLVMESQDQLLNRRLDRIEFIGWKLLVAQVYSILGPSGAVIHADDWTGLFQTFTASPVWSTVATATPLADFRGTQLLGRGHSVNLGAQATAYMNRTTLNNMLNNTNAADLYGRRTTGLGTYNSLPQVQTLLTADDLPNIVVYDEGYLSDGTDGFSAGSFQLFIPNGKVVLVGARTNGEKVGEYRFTRNVNNPDMSPGPYMKVFDRGEMEVPRKIEVHDGHNGGPVIYYPSSVVIMSV